LNSNSYVVPNGVNYELFLARANDGEIPADIRSIPRPVIGHVGAIQWDLDFALLHKMASAHPEWSLVFVGPRESGDSPEFDALVSRPNVYYLGCKRASEVPAYISCCDVCILPYHAANATVLDTDSVKLYEYLACGRPVVSVDVPSARRFEPLVRIAGDSSSFIRSVEESLAEDVRLVERRKAAARQHSWRQRVVTLSQLIVSRLARGSCGDRRRIGALAARGTGP
jgi:hypothetical protein